jgi:hypothetical protein
MSTSRKKKTGAGPAKEDLLTAWRKRAAAWVVGGGLAVLAARKLWQKRAARKRG